MRSEDYEDIRILNEWYRDQRRTIKTRWALIVVEDHEKAVAALPVDITVSRILVSEKSLLIVHWHGDEYAVPVIPMGGIQVNPNHPLVKMVIREDEMEEI